MSIVKLNKNNFATKSVNLSTNRQFISSSMGVTGALKVIVDRSHTQKDSVDDRVGLTGENRPQPFGENTFEGRREIIMQYLAGRALDPEDPMYIPSFLDTNNGELELAQLLDGSGIFAGAIPPEYEKYGFSASDDPFTETGYSDISMHPRNSTELLVRALKPTSSMFSSGSMALTMAEKILEPYHRVRNSMIGSQYVNFNCMNFFDAQDPMALMYHGELTLNGNDVYNIDADFSIEFWIKPRPSTSRGTILHHRGIFSVALIPNTAVDHEGKPLNYAIGLVYGNARTRLESHKPSSTIYGTTSDTQISNYFIEHDTWTHVAIAVNKQGQEVLFYKDGKVATARIDRGSFPSYVQNDLVVVGSFFHGSTHDPKRVQSQGLGTRLTDADISPTEFKDNLNAELHEVRIWNKLITKKDIQDNQYKTITGSLDYYKSANLIFYVPCLYDVDYRNFPTHVVSPELVSATEIDSLTLQPEGFKQIYNAGEGTSTRSTRRAGVVNTGAIPSNFGSLAEIYDSRTRVVRRQQPAPYNTNHANIGNFANINIQSYLKDYANIQFPYCHHLSESFGNPNSPLQPTFDTYDPNSALDTVHALTSSFSLIKGHQARNCFVLPCDNGSFRPDYNTLYHPTGSKYLTRNGFMINTKDIGDLDDILDSKMFFIDDVFVERESFAVEAVSRHTTQGGDTRYNSGLDLFAVVDEDPLDSDIPNFTLPSVDDPNFTSIFDSSDFPGPLTTIITVPQLYYGNRIKPGSIRIRSNLYDGSKSHVELRDNGEGILYRHQTSGSVANWNKVGDVYYGEGLIYVRNPSLYAISDSDLDLEFKSENKTNVLETNVFCKAGLVNSSSNPNHVKIKPSADENEAADEFVYISTIYLHDDNLNVVAKAKLAQPIIKRSENKFLFRLKVDF